MTSGIGSASGAAEGGLEDTAAGSRAVPRVPAAARWLPTVLAAAAVAVQLGYPRLDGQARDLATILSVVVFAAASITHAWTVHGGRTAARVIAVLAGGGLLVEAVGVATGVPFGRYAYDDRLGAAVLGVPIVIPLAWCMLGYPALVVARRITPHGVLGPLIGAVALAAWDLYLDPQMVAEGYWTWQADGPHLIGTIPVSNYLAWFGVAWAMMALLWPTARSWLMTPEALRVPIALYVWTWAGSLVAHLALFDLPQSALYGGVGMGAVVALLAWRLWDERGRAGRTRVGRGR